MLDSAPAKFLNLFFSSIFGFPGYNSNKVEVNLRGSSFTVMKSVLKASGARRRMQVAVAVFGRPTAPSAQTTRIASTPFGLAAHSLKTFTDAKRGRFGIPPDESNSTMSLPEVEGKGLVARLWLGLNGPCSSSVLVLCPSVLVSDLYVNNYYIVCDINYFN